MTTLVRTRQPLQVLSMSHQPERRKSKRLAGTSSPEPEEPELKRRRTAAVTDSSQQQQQQQHAPATGRKKRKNDADSKASSAAPAVYDEQDGDFLFTRGSKRVKTTPAPPAPPPAPEPEPEPELPLPKPSTAKKVGRPPKNSSKKRASSPAAQQSAPPPPPPPPPTLPAQQVLPRRTSKRRSSAAAQAAPQPVQDEEPVMPKAKTRRKGRESNADKKAREEAAQRRQLIEGIPEEEEEEEEQEEQQQQQHQQRHNHRDQDHPMTNGTPQAEHIPAAGSQMISLPFSDTPIQNRNKEFRKKGGASGGRRSSLGMRGRRASSLIDNGQSALPHREVDPKDFYKYISAEGLSEPRRMKQLLIWCGERALSEKPRGGKGNSAVLGARAIQDQILKDFASVSEFSDWFSREEAPKPPVVLKPNPRNEDYDRKIEEMEERIKRLKQVKKAWQAIAKPLPTLDPIYPLSTPPPADNNNNNNNNNNPPEDQQPPQPDPRKAPLPDPKLLTAEEGEMLSFLTSPETSFGSWKRQVRSRLQNVHQELELEVDVLADRVHKFDMRVGVAGREADEVLRRSAGRLREREEREKRGVGTERVGVWEVLRSLGRILPEGG
ncbi:putative kinetochore protein mis13 [Cercophora samala]|uniref:Kinetochore protein mis13 n=1 Tax=Cercophora samala TaxID=330535 RepID=A0AA39YWI4_9PEZI|nr:putative kinetochore protein mis13 [Cercophora samala]